MANTLEYLIAVATPASAPAVMTHRHRGLSRDRSDIYTVAITASTIPGSLRTSVVVSIERGAIATITAAKSPARSPTSRRPIEPANGDDSRAHENVAHSCPLHEELDRELIGPHREPSRQLFHVADERPGDEQPEDHSRVVLDRLVVQLAGDEEVLDVGGEPVLVHVDGRVAELAVQAWQPEHDREQDDEQETGLEPVRFKETNCLSPVIAVRARQNQQNHERGGQYADGGKPRLAHPAEPEHHHRRHNGREDAQDARPTCTSAHWSHSMKTNVRRRGYRTTDPFSYRFPDRCGSRDR